MREHGLERMGSLEVLMEPGEGHWKQRDMAITATRTPSCRGFARSCSSSYSARFLLLCAAPSLTRV